MTDKYDELAQALLGDCSDELNPMYESANLKHEIAAAIRKYGVVVEITEQMRTAQRAYFKDRKQTDLAASKKLERDVDDRIERLKRGAATSNNPQATLL